MDYAGMSVGSMAEEHAAEGPLPQIVAGSIEKLLARGSERGYVTYDELSATVPLDQLSSEEIEDTMTMLSELGITVTESDEREAHRGWSRDDARRHPRKPVDVRRHSRLA